MRVRTSAEHWVRALSAPHPQEADFRVGRTSKALGLPLRYPLFHVHAAFPILFHCFHQREQSSLLASCLHIRLLTKRGVLPLRPLQGFSQMILDESRGHITLLSLLDYCKA